MSGEQFENINHPDEFRVPLQTFSKEILIYFIRKKIYTFSNFLVYETILTNRLKTNFHHVFPQFQKKT